MTTAATEAPPAAKPTSWGETFEIAKTVIYALAIALVLRILLFQPFTIPSASMEPTLLQGDYIIVSKYTYGYSRHSIPFSPPLFHGRVLERIPRRGDIVVFKLPRDGHTDYIKRLVGLPGDRIQVLHSVLYLNGRPVPRQELESTTRQTAFANIDEFVHRYKETIPSGRSYMTYDLGDVTNGDNTGIYTVPPGCFFMMGDNRDNSADSRFYPGLMNGKSADCGWDSRLGAPSFNTGVGFVPAENLVGKAEVILLSWNPPASLFKPWTWLTEARPSRFFTLLK